MPMIRIESPATSTSTSQVATKMIVCPRSGWPIRSSAITAAAAARLGVCKGMPFSVAKWLVRKAVSVGRAARGNEGQRIRSSRVRATTLVALRRSSSTRCSSARLALDSNTVRGPAP